MTRLPILSAFALAVTIRVKRAPHPVFPSADRNYDFVQMPLVVWLRTILSDASCKISTKTIHPQPDSFPTEDQALFGRPVFNG